MGGIKGFLENIEDVLGDLEHDAERVAKDIVGRDVPKSPLRDHPELKEKARKLLMDVLAKAAEMGRDAIKDIRINGELMPMDFYDAVIKILADKFIEIGEDE